MQEILGKITNSEQSESHVLHMPCEFLHKLYSIIIFPSFSKFPISHICFMKFKNSSQ